MIFFTRLIINSDNEYHFMLESEDTDGFLSFCRKVVEIHDRETKRRKGLPINQTIFVPELSQQVLSLFPHAEWMEDNIKEALNKGC